MSSVYLPHELVLEILTWLPVKHLYRFRCVCKLWNSFTTDRNFIDAQLNKANQLCNNNGYFVYVEPWVIGFLPRLSRKELCMVTCNSDHTVNEVSRYLFPYVCLYSKILGVCNGLVCLRSADDKCFMMNLWNPRIQKLKELPKLMEPETLYSAFGFAYDSQNNDYKVIRIAFDPNRFEAAVYSLSTNSWRKLEQPTRDKSNYLKIVYMDGTHTQFSNGALHWISAIRDNGVFSPIIVAFDVNEERFRVILFPGITKNCGFLTDYKGSLAMRGYASELWVMKEYGVVESWTKQILDEIYWVDLEIKHSKYFGILSPIVHTTNSIESLVLADK
jgi:F-box interacting protein